MAHKKLTLGPDEELIVTISIGKKGTLEHITTLCGFHIEGSHGKLEESYNNAALNQIKKILNVARFAIVHILDSRKNGGKSE